MLKIIMMVMTTLLNLFPEVSKVPKEVEKLVILGLICKLSIGR